MYYSYVMGIDDSILNLETQGFTINKDGNNYRVSFPEDKARCWEEFIKKYLEVEYWNEYLTEDKVIFYFIYKMASRGMRRKIIINRDCAPR